MKYLEEMDMLMYLQKKLKIEQRDQWTQSDIESIKSVVGSVVQSMGKDITSQMHMTTEDMYNALVMIEQLNYQSVPAEVKQTLAEGLIVIKYELAQVAFSHYSLEPFEVNPEIIRVMKEIVITKYGGDI